MQLKFQVLDGGDNKCLCNNSISTSICKVQNWMNSCDKIDCTEARSQVIRAYSAPTSTQSKKRLKSKSSVASAKTGKSVTCPNQKLATTLKSTSMVHEHQPKSYAAHMPIQITTDIKRIERPDRTCSCLSNAVTARERYILQRFNPVSIQQVAQRMSNTRCLLSGLKTEINKVKSQLNDISIATRNNLIDTNNQVKSEQEISQLSLQNIHLKKELDLKNQRCVESLKDVEKTRQILNDYEKKVVSLHDQAIKSTKLIKQSKEKFCKCLKEKESQIQQLKISNETLLKIIQEKECRYAQMNSEYESLRNTFQEGSSKLLSLSDESKNFTECIKILEKHLDNAVQETQQYKEEVKKLEEQIINFECKVCQKLEVKIKKQKCKLNNKIKEHEEREMELLRNISDLNNQLEIAKELQFNHENPQNRYLELENQLEQHDSLVKKYEMLEQKYQQDCEMFRVNEINYNKDREQLRNLVDELTLVVKQNKVTLLQLSAINKHQEQLLLSQTSVINEKDDKLKIAKSEVEMLRKQSFELKEEVEILRKSLTEPCTHESHLHLLDQIRDIRVALKDEVDRKVINEKIIEEQNKTILQLQKNIKEKISELKEVKEECFAAEEEIMIINEDLLRTHKELENQISQKELIHIKFKELQNQNSTLSIEMSELEGLLQEKLGTAVRQQDIDKLEQQIKDIKKECEIEKAKLRSEKDKAVEAAQFATQKLLDTVSDFQKQVSAQKKVQYLLTKMLHDKEEDLRTVHKRLNSINSLTVNIERDFPVNEIFKSNQLELSDHNTTSSFLSTCSHCSCYGKRPKSKTHHLYNTFITDEQPIKD